MYKVMIEYHANLLCLYTIYCISKSCLPMLLLVFSKHGIIESFHQTKHISFMLQMTPTAHIWVNSKHERQLHKIYQQRASSNTKHQHHEVTEVSKPQLHKGSCTSHYPQPVVLTYIYSKETQTQCCVSRYHFARLVNSQVYTLQPDTDTWQTRVK